MKVMKVRGTVSKEYEPDKIIIPIKLNSYGDSVISVTKILNNKIIFLQNDLNSFGIENCDIEIIVYNINDNTKIKTLDIKNTSYIGNYSLEVTLKNKDKIKNFIIMLGNSKSSPSFSTIFTMKDISIIEEELSVLALQKSINLTNLLTKEANIKIGEIVKIEYNNFISSLKIESFNNSIDLFPKKIKFTQNILLETEIK